MNYEVFKDPLNAYWFVVEDGNRVSEDHKTEADAYNWIREHEAKNNNYSKLLREALK